MHELRDDQRVLRFDGTLLASSSSKKPGSPRWIEFALYRTQADRQYVLGRIGHSSVYHHPDCPIAVRGRIQPVPFGDLSTEASPCEQCLPDPRDFPLVAPEEKKTWARVFSTPEKLLKGILKADSNGQLYMTAVARRLIEDAVDHDEDLDQAYRVQIVT